MRAITGRFGITPAAWFNHPEINLNEIGVLSCLSTYADEQGWCYPSQATIASQLGRSRALVNEALKRLTRISFDHLPHGHPDKVYILEKKRRFKEDGSEIAALYRIRYDCIPAEPDRAPTTQEAQRGSQSGAPVTRATPPVATMTPPVAGVTPPGAGATGPVGQATPPVVGTTQTDSSEPDSVDEDLSPGIPSPQGAGRSVDQPQRERTRKQAVLENWSPQDSTRHWFEKRFPDDDIALEVERFACVAQAQGWRYVDIDAGFKAWMLQRPTSPARRQTSKQPGGANGKDEPHRDNHTSGSRRQRTGGRAENRAERNRELLRAAAGGALRPGERDSPAEEPSG